MTALGERLAVFDDHNLFFIAVLGLASAGPRFDRLVEEFGSAALGPSPLSPDAIRRDAALCCILGVVSLREALRGHLEAAAASPTPKTPTPAATASKIRPSHRDLLR